MKNQNKINEINMGFAVGLVSAGLMLLLSIFYSIGIYKNATIAMVNLHMFYAPTFLGTIYGMIEASIIGFFVVYILIVVYNFFQDMK